MLRHQLIARKTSNTRGSAARSCGSCWSFPNIRLVARGIAANQYAIALLELTCAVSKPVQNAVSPSPHASRLFSFTNKMRSHQPVSHCLWHAIIEIAFSQSQRVSSHSLDWKRTRWRNWWRRTHWRGDHKQTCTPSRWSKRCRISDHIAPRNLDCVESACSNDECS